MPGTFQVAGDPVRLRGKIRTYIKIAGSLATRALAVIGEVGGVERECRGIPHGNRKLRLLGGVTLRVLVKPQIATRATHGIEAVIGRILSITLIGLGWYTGRIRILG